MKPILKSTLIVFLLFLFQSVLIKGNDSINYSISLKYSLDLSDTYGGGQLFTGEFTISKLWYGGKINFGHFQSQYSSLFKVPYEEIGQTLEIYIPEMAIMKIGTISGFVRPVKNKWITADLIFGGVYGRSRCFYLKEIEYEYSIPEQKFIRLLKDYQLVKRNHFGYQVGIDVSFYVLKKAGLQINARIQDLSNGGAFFFVGGGLCFRI